MSQTRRDDLFLVTHYFLKAKGVSYSSDFRIRQHTNINKLNWGMVNHLGWRTGKADQGGPKEASFIRVQVTVPSNGVEILTVLLVL